MPGLTDDVFKLIRDERIRQDEKWGPQNHIHGEWALILLEEIGEAAQALLDGNPLDGAAELVQAAAVCVAWLESAMANADLARDLKARYD